jgi:glycosyltransferase involved in cell wall biosynthesis
MVGPDHSLTKVEIFPANLNGFFIGRFQTYKGVDLLVDVNRPESPGSFSLFMAPDGYDQYFDDLKAMMNSNDRIRYAGMLDQADLPQAFAEADYLVLPSLWHENTPITVLEAMQSKTPVIASNIAGVTDVIKDGVNGLLFPMGDRGALEKALQQAIDTPDQI